MLDNGKTKNNLATKVRFSTYYEYKIDQNSLVIIFVPSRSPVSFD